MYTWAIKLRYLSFVAYDSTNFKQSFKQGFLSVEIIQKYSSCERYAYNLTYCTDVDDLPSCLNSQGNKEEVGAMTCDQGYNFSKDLFDETTISEVSACEITVLSILFCSIFSQNVCTSTTVIWISIGICLNAGFLLIHIYVYHL